MSIISFSSTTLDTLSCGLIGSREHIGILRMYGGKSLIMVFELYLIVLLSVVVVCLVLIR